MWRIAWRNIWRNRTRTIISLTAISLSYALFLVAIGMAESTYTMMEQEAAKNAGGNLLIHQAGYWAAQSSDYVLSDPHHIMQTADELEEVLISHPRVISNCLVSSAHGSTATRLMGIDPAREARLLDLSGYVSEGSFLSGDERNPLVLGRGIVDTLALSLGERVVLTASLPNGDATRALFRLAGILDTGMRALDDFAAYTTIDAAQNALALGQGLTQIGLTITNDSLRFEVREKLLESLPPELDLEIITWDEAIPEMVGYIEIDKAFAYIYALLTLIIVGFGIANTFLMSVMERVREFGLLSAIGMKPSRLLTMVFYEALCLATVSLVIGLALGSAIHTYLAIEGLDLAALGDLEMDVSGVSLANTIIYSRFNPVSWTLATLSVLAMVLLSALYPAWKARKMKPAQAMRTFQ